MLARQLCVSLMPIFVHSDHTSGVFSRCQGSCFCVWLLLGLESPVQIPAAGPLQSVCGDSARGAELTQVLNTLTGDRNF